MQKREHLSRLLPAIPAHDLPLAAQAWLDDGECRQLSAETLSGRRIVIEKLIWFLQQQEAEFCGRHELRQFFAYMGRPTPQGRWGNPRLTEPASPSSVKTYYTRLSAFFAFLVEDGIWKLEASPMAGLKPPVVRDDQIQPFTAAELSALEAAVKKTANPARDEALLLFLLDTGARASEVVALNVWDLDLKQKRCRVVGKGNKVRTVLFGTRTMRALWAYLRQHEREEEEEAPLWLSDRGRRPQERLTRSGLLQMFERLGKLAEIQSARCSPHTCRHTFAVEFLKNGGNMYALMELLGHTTLAMTKRYVALAEADLQSQHRRFSPVDCRRAALRQRRS